MKTVIACDLDGTLIGSDNKVSDENFGAIQRLSKKGVKITVLTGRTFYEIPVELQECKYIDYFVFSNGAGIRNADKKTVYYYPIRRSSVKKIYDVLSSYEVFCEFYSNQTVFISEDKFSEKCFEYYRIDKIFLQEILRSRKTVSSIEELTDSEAYETEMFNVFFRSLEEREHCINRLRGEFSDIELTMSMKNNLEIMNKGVNKGSGLKEMCRIAGYDIEDVIVIGDSKNDVSAFAVAKKRYAVSNACPELKNRADKIICSNDENVMCYMEDEL